jgi:thiopurine S-methyltransferase
MHADFWLDRWQREQIGFHRDAVNPNLLNRWPELELDPGTRVLVPLCGKSHDLSWLAERHEVAGIELSAQALKQFWSEAGIEPTFEEGSRLSAFRHRNLTTYAGDFFELDHTQVGLFGAVYDRAALIALPPEMRSRYLTHMKTLLAPGAVILMVLLEYVQAEMPGPPFSVSPKEVEAAFASGFQVEVLESQEVLSSVPKFLERGLSSLTQHVLRIERLA